MGRDLNLYLNYVPWLTGTHDRLSNVSIPSFKTCQNYIERLKLGIKRLKLRKTKRTTDKRLQPFWEETKWIDE